MMNNDFLVELVENNQYYLELKRPRDKRVLDAMRKVDRGEFIPPDLYLDICYISPSAFTALYNTLVRLDDEIKQSGLRDLLDNILESEKLDKDHEGYDFSKINQKGIEALLRNLPAMITNMNLVSASTKRITINMRDIAYNDIALEIGYNQTCSQPSLVGLMTDILELEEGMKVLEVGSGCGYHAAITSHLIGKEGKLVTIEYVKELKKLAEDNLKAQFGKEYEQRVKVVHGDGSVGLKEEASFDRIYLTAGVDLKSFDASILSDQLNHEKSILLFSESSGVMIKQTYKDNKMVEEERIGSFSFVPLRGKNS